MPLYYHQLTTLHGRYSSFQFPCKWSIGSLYFNQIDLCIPSVFSLNSAPNFYCFMFETYIIWLWFHTIHKLSDTFTSQKQSARYNQIVYKHYNVMCIYVTVQLFNTPNLFIIQIKFMVCFFFSNLSDLECVFSMVLFVLMDIILIVNISKLFFRF